MECYKTVKESVCAEITEKHSRFIATVSHCESESEAQEFINGIRKKYWDARHNVYAFCLREGALKRFSDDGEPHSTAGLPVLESITGFGLTDTLVVVTRYFGGTLLGTGGLVRAYSKSAGEALSKAKIVAYVFSVYITVRCDYKSYEMLLKISDRKNVKILKTDFSDLINITLVISEAEYDNFCLTVRDNFCGKLQINELYRDFYGFE